MIEINESERILYINKELFNEKFTKNNNVTEELNGPNKLKVIIQSYNLNNKYADISNSCFIFKGIVDNNLQQDTIGRHISIRDDKIFIHHGYFKNGDKHGLGIRLSTQSNSLYWSLMNKRLVNSNYGVNSSIGVLSEIVISDIEYGKNKDVYMNVVFKDDLLITNQIKQVLSYIPFQNKDKFIKSEIFSSYIKEISIRLSSESLSENKNVPQMKIYILKDKDSFKSEGFLYDNLSNPNEIFIYKGSFLNKIPNDENGFLYSLNKDQCFIGKFINGAFIKGDIIFYASKLKHGQHKIYEYIPCQSHNENENNQNINYEKGEFVEKKDSSSFMKLFNFFGTIKSYEKYSVPEYVCLNEMAENKSPIQTDIYDFIFQIFIKGMIVLYENINIDYCVDNLNHVKMYRIFDLLKEVWSLLV